MGDRTNKKRLGGMIKEQTRKKLEEAGAERAEMEKEIKVESGSRGREMENPRYKLDGGMKKRREREEMGLEYQKELKGREEREMKG